MFELFLFITGLILAIFWLIAYRRSGDALQPLVYIAPLMAFQYVVRPWQLYQQGELQRLLPEMWILELGAFVHLLGVIGFCWGCMPDQRGSGQPPLWRMMLSPQMRQNLVRLAIVLGCIAAFFFYYSVFAAGGITKAFGRPKGGGIRLSSGYFGEAIGFCVPAVVLLLVAWQRSRLKLPHWMLIAFLASPYLLTGLLGTRRGPTFMILGAMAFTWFLVRVARPKLLRVVATVALICFVVLLVFLNRPRLYIGSPEPIDWWAPWRFLTGKAGASEGDDYAVACANIAVRHQTGKFGWGRSLLITFFIRPIPRQWWPTQYEDATRFLFSPSELVTGEDFRSLIGWIPASGSAIGAVADLFREFSFLVVFAMFLYGRFYREVWRLARTRGGIWVPVYVIAASLSIYIPTQSMSAVFHRFLFLSVCLAVAWRLFVGPFVSPSPIYTPPRTTPLPIWSARPARAV
ncbi:MAG: hypothetical protein QXT77_03190 [Candidatus Methanomethylicaceae archaeon]